MEGAAMLKRMSHVMFYVHDLERACRWWTDKLGFKTLFFAPQHYAAVQHAGMGCRIDLHPAKPDSLNVGHGAVTFFTTDDLDKTVAELRAQGIKVTDPRSEGGSPRFCSFYDSEGNELGMSE